MNSAIDDLDELLDMLEGGFLLDTHCGGNYYGEADLLWEGETVATVANGTWLAATGDKRVSKISLVYLHPHCSDYTRITCLYS